MNNIALMGRLTRDPILRQTQSGLPVASFSLAVDRGYSPKDGGERQTDFIDVVVWRGTAEFISRYFTKGQMAAVTGRLQIRDWTDREKNKRRSAEVVADSVYFTGSKKSREESFSPADSVDYMKSGNVPAVEGSDFTDLDMDDGDLPF